MASARSQTAPAVVYIRIAGAVQSGLPDQIRRAVDRGRASGAAAVILDVDLQGGKIDAAQLAAGHILDSPLPVYAFVNSAAWMAGALVALSADSVFMETRSTIGGGDAGDGDATPYALRQLRSEFRALALRRGFDHRVAEAMVEAQEPIDGVAGVGNRVTLSARQATDLGLAAGEVRDVDHLLEVLGLAGAQLESSAAEPDYAGITVRVTNRNWRDIRVYMTYGEGGGPIRSRLGTVTSMNDSEFVIPAQASSVGETIQLLAEVIGSSERVTTQRLTAQPGLVIEWIVANVISQSNYFYYIR